MPFCALGLHIRRARGTRPFLRERVVPGACSARPITCLDLEIRTIMETFEGLVWVVDKIIVPPFASDGAAFESQHRVRGEHS